MHGLTIRIVKVHVCKSKRTALLCHFVFTTRRYSKSLPFVERLWVRDPSSLLHRIDLRPKIRSTSPVQIVRMVKWRNITLGDSEILRIDLDLKTETTF